MRQSYRTVLCPTDLSELGDGAIAVAYLVVAEGGTVHCLHVLEPRADGDELAEEEDARRQLASRGLPAGEWRARTHGYVHVVRAADVAGTIERQARHHGADVIVMATHGRTGLRRVFLGSVAEDVVQRFDLPVILVHGGEASDGA